MIKYWESTMMIASRVMKSAARSDVEEECFNQMMKNLRSSCWGCLRYWLVWASSARWSECSGGWVGCWWTPGSSAPRCCSRSSPASSAAVSPPRRRRTTWPRHHCPSTPPLCHTRYWNNQSEVSIELCQPIRDYYCIVSTNQRLALNYVTQSEISIKLYQPIRV